MRETNKGPRTIRVRIAVAVDPDGNWRAYGGPTKRKGPHPLCFLDGFIDDLASGEAYSWVTAELPVPEACEVEGEVSQ